MRKTTQEKVARLLISSLMSSDLTSKELIDFCQSLIDGDPFVKDLGYNLQNLVGNTMYSSSPLQSDDEIEYVFRLLKQRKLTKDALFTIIDDLFSGLGDYLKSQKLSLRMILEVVREQVDSTGWKRFVGMLKNDDYLDHILDRDLL